MKNLTLNNNDNGLTTLGDLETEEIKCLISYVLLDLRRQMGEEPNLGKCFFDANIYVEDCNVYVRYFKAIVRGKKEERRYEENA